MALDLVSLAATTETELEVRQVARWPEEPRGSAVGVAFFENRAYLALGKAGVSIVDLTDPSHPRRLGGLVTGGTAIDVKAANDLLYVADSDAGLKILDVSDPSQPRQLSAYDTPGQCLEVTVVDSLAYVADGGAGLQILDVADPKNPRWIGTFDTPGWAEGVAVSGNLALVADFKSGLAILDVSNPAQPNAVGSHPTESVAVDVAVDGAFAYVSAFDKGLEIFDLSNPALPKRVGRCDTPHVAGALVIRQHRAYVADGNAGLQIIDLQNPRAPRILGAFLPGPGGSASGVAMANGQVLLADGPLGLQTIDVSIPQTPRRISRFPTLGVATDIAVAGQQVFLADVWGGLALLDVSDPEHPRLAGVHIADGVAYGVAVAGSTAIVANSSAGLERVDFSAPAAPRTIEKIYAPGAAARVTLRDHYAFVASQNAGLQIYDLENQNGLRWVGGTDTGGNARGIALRNEFAYITTTIAGLQIINISDPARPRRVGGCESGVYAWDVAVSGSHAYVANESSLGIIDISDPTQPRKVTELTGIQAWGVTLTNDLLFVAAGPQGLKVFDVSVPTEPRLVGSSTPEGNAWEVVVSGSYAYVADSTQELRVFRVARPADPGKLKWTFSTGRQVWPSPALAPDGTVIVGSDSGTVVALDGQTGARKWESTTGGLVRSSPAIGNNGTVYVGSNNGKVHAMDLVTGELRWTFATGGDVESSPAVDALGTVFVGSLDGKLYALDGLTGVRRWVFETGGPVRSSPAVGDDGTVFVGSDDFNMYALDGKTGVRKWSFATQGKLRSSPALGPVGLLYIGSSDGKVYAVDPSTGRQIWAFQTGAAVDSSPVTTAEGTVYVGSNDGSIYALDGRKGVKRWSFATGESVSATPAVGADGAVYVGSQNGTLFAFDGIQDRAQWKLPTGGPIVSSAAVGADGTVYFGSHDGMIYAVAASAGGGLASSPWPKFRGNPRNTGQALPYGLPRIVAQPEDQSVTAGGTATFKVVATGTSPLTYSWRANGISLAATNTTLVVSKVRPDQVGEFVVVVANDFGSVTSRVASLTLIPYPQGTLLFSTRSGDSVNAPVSLWDGTLVDDRFLGQCYAGVPGSQLKPVGDPVPFGSGADRGYITNGGILTVPDVAAGGPVQVKLVAWNATLGATYEDAVAHLAGDVGESPIILVLAGGGLASPAPLTGLPTLHIPAIGGLSPPPMRVVTWSTNGHAYQLIGAYGLPWAQARGVAESLRLEGRIGHLATITSPEENRFLTEHPDLGLGSGQRLERYWIGAYRAQNSGAPNGTWRWVTDEPFGFSNWHPTITNDPPGVESHACFYLGVSTYGRQWSSESQLADSPPIGFVIEYDAADSSIPTVLSARTLNDRHHVTVTFSEPMDPATASQSANYQFRDGSPVNGVLMTASNTVVISTRLTQPGWQVLRISDVRQARLPKAPVSPGTEVTFALTDGWANWSLFDQTGPGGSTEDLLAKPAILDGLPDRSGFFPSFEFAEYEHGAELTGRLQAFLYPPVSGSYRFWLYGDDSCLLYLSTTGEPSRKRLIARQNISGAYRHYRAASEPMILEVGRTYYLEAVYKESGGSDGVGVTWQLPGGAAPAVGDPPISGEFLSAYKTSGQPRILRTIRDPVVASGEALSLGLALADIDGSPPFSFQWYRDGQGIAGATNLEFNLTWVGPADHGASFVLQVTNLYGTAISTAVQLRVLQDSQKPEVSRVAGSAEGTTVTVVFSEVIDETSATQLAHYELTGGLSVTRVVRESDGRTVLLSTSPQTLGANYELRVHGVRDLAGHEIAPATRVTFPTFAEYPGLALREVWKSTRIGTSMDSLLRLPRFTSNQPSFSHTLQSLEAPMDVMDRYGQRVSGWLVAPTTGDYVFSIAANDACRLFLSRDDSPAGLGLVVSQDDGTEPREWNKYASQTSSPIPLVSGSAYYFEALMVEDGGSDNLAVGWIRPGSDSIEVIEGVHLRLRTDPRHLQPTIVRQPVALTRYQYAPGLLSIGVQPAAYSQAQLRYQWQRNEVDVPGATTSELFLPPGADTRDSGARYRCVITDSAAPSGPSLISSEAEVRVLPQDEPSPLRIQHDENGLALTWRPEPGLRLQEASRSSQPDWKDVPNTEGAGALTLKPTDQARFLRLWKTEITPRHKP